MTGPPWFWSAVNAPKTNRFREFFWQPAQALIIQQPLEATLFAPQDFICEAFFVYFENIL